MRKVVTFSLITLGIILACNWTNNDKGPHTLYNQTGGNPFPHIISNGKLGSVSIGDGIDSTLKKLTSWFNITIDSIPTCEGCSVYTPLYIVTDKYNNKPLFFIESGWEDANKDNVFRISTSNESIVTDRFIKVGMTVGDLKKKYEIQNVDINMETGLHIIVKDFHGSFGIRTPDGDNWWQYKSETISDTLRIEEIIII